MLIDEEKIESFWQWFVQNDVLIKNSIEQELADERSYIVEQLNNHILGFGMLKWDLGLDDSQNWFFTLSPNGDKDLLVITERIIDNAPHFLSWKFHASKQASSSGMIVSLYDNEMETLEIDASPWHYIAFIESDGKIELILEAKNVKNIDEDIIELAANLLVVNEIGEKMRILHVSTISIVSELSAEDEDSKYPISDLRNHFSVFENNNY
jgi:hypothetical protein